MGSSNESVIKTLLYSDIFDYPLTPEEIWKFLISSKKSEKKKILKQLDGKNALYESMDNLFFIKGRKQIVVQRKEREKYSLQKIKFAVKIIKKLGMIPTVYFIGISGALAMKNSQKDDDIDLFVITKRNSVWITRLLLITILSFLGVYRKKDEKKVSNKICLNMLVDEAVLVFPKQRKDLYTAHEIAQVLPVLNKNKTYEKFIGSNYWVKNFLPNAFAKKPEIFFTSKTGRINLFINYLLRVPIIEYLARNIQYRHMKKHITNETVLNNFLAFHPFDYKSHVLASYKNKASEYL